MADDFYVRVGNGVTFSKTIGESDVYLFAGMIGDFARIHIDAEYARQTPIGQRVVHGAFIIGLMSTMGTLLIDTHERKVPGVQSYSVGYDRVRFIRPVFIGDTIRLVDTVTGIDHEKRRSRTKVEAFNQRGEIVAAAEHLIQWVGEPTS